MQADPIFENKPGFPKRQTIIIGTISRLGLCFRFQFWLFSCTHQSDSSRKGAELVLRHPLHPSYRGINQVSSERRCNEIANIRFFLNESSSDDGILPVAAISAHENLPSRGATAFLARR